MSGLAEIWVAHDHHEVLLWRRSEPATQRVVRVHTSAPALLRALEKKGEKPAQLEATWITRTGFEAMLSQSLVDPDGVRPGKRSCIDKLLQAQHRLATRFAQIRVAFDEHAEDRPAPLFSLRNAARHTLRHWTIRTASVDVRSWERDGMDKAFVPRAFAVDPTVWCSWVSA